MTKALTTVADRAFIQILGAEGKPKKCGKQVTIPPRLDIHNPQKASYLRLFTSFFSFLLPVLPEPAGSAWPWSAQE